jgi:hypothetical protein
MRVMSVAALYFAVVFGVGLALGPSAFFGWSRGLAPSWPVSARRPSSCYVVIAARLDA